MTDKSGGPGTSYSMVTFARWKQESHPIVEHRTDCVPWITSAIFAARKYLGLTKTPRWLARALSIGVTSPEHNAYIIG